MHTIRCLPEFDAWIVSVRDLSTRVRLKRRLDRAANGTLGNVKPVGKGVFEMREAFGPGWRMYYIVRGHALIVMLGGGDKASQAADIAKAMKLAAAIED